MSGSYQCFFVCKGNVFACKDCFHGRSDPDHSYDGSHQNIGFLHSGKFDETAHLAYDLYVKITDSRFQISGCFFFPDCNQFRVKFPDLLLQHLYVAACSKADYF